MAQNYIFFYGENNTHGYFSQWYDSSFTDGVNTYSNAETYMMYHKAILFNDENTTKRILTSGNPSHVKRLGRQIRDFDEKTWNTAKEKIVSEGNYLKFTQNEILQNALLKTENYILVEASPYDRVWGIGYNKSDALRNKNNWGRNLLGKCLMLVRERIKKELNEKKLENKENKENKGIKPHRT